MPRSHSILISKAARKKSILCNGRGWTRSIGPWHVGLRSIRPLRIWQHVFEFFFFATTTGQGKGRCGPLPVRFWLGFGIPSTHVRCGSLPVLRDRLSGLRRISVALTLTPDTWNGGRICQAMSGLLHELAPEQRSITSMVELMLETPAQHYNLIAFLKLMLSWIP